VNSAEADAAGTGPTSPAVSRVDETAADEDLVARLNRALVEQAWLRGVDLT
jgi:hypothetical protein